MKSDVLPAGTKVRVRRITGEEVDGIVIRGPLEYLCKIGEFYIIGRKEPIDETEAPYYCGRGKKSRARREYEERMGEIGMYEREKITVRG